MRAKHVLAAGAILYLGFALLLLQGGLPSAMVTFTSGTVISSADVNSNFTSLFTPLNGNIESVNILNGTIAGADISSTTTITVRSLGTTVSLTIPSTAGDPAANAGTLKINSTTGKMRVYTTAQRTVPFIEEANTYSGNNTFSGNNAHSGNTTFTGGAGSFKFIPTATFGTADFITSDSNLHLNSGDSDNGGWISNGGSNQIEMSAGVRYDGNTAQYVARNANASLFRVGGTFFRFLSDTGLSVGGNYTPTLRLTVEQDGDLICTGHPQATTDNTLDLGTATVKWRKLYAHSSNITSTGAPSASGDIKVNASTSKLEYHDGTAARTVVDLQTAQTFTATKTFQTIAASADATYDIGASGTEFNNGYFENVFAAARLNVPRTSGAPGNAGDLKIDTGASNAVKIHDGTASRTIRTDASTYTLRVPASPAAVVQGLSSQHSYIADLVDSSDTATRFNFTVPPNVTSATPTLTVVVAETVNEASKSVVLTTQGSHFVTALGQAYNAPTSDWTNTAAVFALDASDGRELIAFTQTWTGWATTFRTLGVRFERVGTSGSDSATGTLLVVEAYVDFTCSY